MQHDKCLKLNLCWVNGLISNKIFRYQDNSSRNYDTGIMTVSYSVNNLFAER